MDKIINKIPKSLSFLIVAIIPNTKAIGARRENTITLREEREAKKLSKLKIKLPEAIKENILPGLCLILNKFIVIVKQL